MYANAEPQKAKSELRKIVKSRLAALSREQIFTAGEFAANLLQQTPGWNTFCSVLAFISMKDEIDTRPILETILNEGKLLFVPRVEGEDLVFYQTGQNNGNTGNPALILKPTDFPALVITPGLAFDRNFNRLGRGRSFYDRFFTALDGESRDYTALGLCMDCQLVDKVPVDTWDKKIDMLLTESGFNVIRN